MPYAVRGMRPSDIPQAIEIDRECFPPQWPTPPYERDLRSNPIAHYLVAHETTNRAVPMAKTLLQKSPLSRLFGKLKSSAQNRGLHRTTQRIDGVIGFWMMADEAHIMTLGVRQRCRRQSIGELLLISAIDLALQLNARIMTLEVGSSNRSAQALYGKYGFANVGVRRGYYGENREDAVIMSTDTITSGSFQELFQRAKKSYAEKMAIDLPRNSKNHDYRLDKPSRIY
jgi:ribosomal-protein-alanine N-acetyltransferase